MKLETGNLISRRGFLRTGVLAGLASAATLGCASHGPHPAGRAASEKTNSRAFGPCLPGAWEKHGVVLESTEPWEGPNVSCFPTRAEPLEKDRWRIWYQVLGATDGYKLAIAEGVPGEPMTKTLLTSSPGEPEDSLFSIGNLPEEWKPIQPVHIQLPNGRHLLYFWAHGPSICRFLLAESSDGRRYTVRDPLRPVLYHPNDRAAYGVPTPDGVMYRNKKAAGRPAEEPLAVPHLITNDATNVYRLPDGSFEMYTVGLVRVPPGHPSYIKEDNAPGLVRSIDRLTSQDGTSFDGRVRVISRQEDEPSDQQFYYLSVTHTDQGRVGMLGSYRCAQQTVDLEWCFSKDGVEWQCQRGVPWVPRGGPPSPDCYGIYPSSQLVWHERKWHLFYTGANHTHNGKKASGKPRQTVMYATVDDIFA